MSVEMWHCPETDEWEIKNVDKADSAAPTASVGSLDECTEDQTSSLFSGILSMLDSHERALLIVADTENKAADAINVSLWLSVVAIAIAVLALALEVLA